jgi:hypothetical protein
VKFLFRVGSDVKWNGKLVTVIDRRMVWSIPFKCDTPRYKIKTGNGDVWVKEFELTDTTA